MMRRREYCRLPRSAFRPLRITAWLQAGVVGDTTLPIDGVLYYQAHRESFGQQQATTPGASDARYLLSSQSLPLARCEEHGPDWYYAASFAEWPGCVADGSEHWNKRFDSSCSDLIDFGSRKARVEIGAAHYKAYHMPIYYRHALWVRWYVFGERAGVERLLAGCTHLGKKASQGWGAVLRWDIEPWSEDWSVRRDGVWMRAVPKVGARVVTGFRPSYWLPKNQMPCALAGEAVGQ